MLLYLDLAGFTSRTPMPSADVQLVESKHPGWIVQQSEMLQSHMVARLRKRYGTNGCNGRAGIPFGLSPAQPSAVGTAPPQVTLQGTPAVGSMRLVLAVVLAGALGAATFQWSQDRGQTWAIGSALAGAGTNPPAVSCSGLSPLASPALLLAAITTAGVLGTSRFQWSQDGGQTWNVGASMASSGTTPPQVFLSGASVLSSPSLLQVQITTAGSLGVAAYQWSQDGGVTWTTGLQTSAQVLPLGQTGLSVSFSPGTYATNNAYTGQGIATAASVPLGTTGLTLGFAAGTYSANNTYAGQGIATAAQVVLGGTGLTASFSSSGPFSADNVYSAATPVPEQLLSWMTAILTPEVYRKRGVNPQDPQLVLLEASKTKAEEELKEAANSETGLLDLPTNDSSDSAVSTGEPLGCSDASPYAWQDRQACAGRAQDAQSYPYPCAGIWGS